MISILPDTALPRITTSRRPPTAAQLRSADVAIVLASSGALARDFAALPEAARWQGLHARAPARPGTVRSTTLANARQSLALIGYLGPRASEFERLALAGRLLKEAATREPGEIVLASLAAGAGAGAGADAGADLEALLSATLAQAFPLPAWRKRPPQRAAGIRRITLAGHSGAGLEQVLAGARGNNLARWLTALPPNILDARAYRRAIATLARRHGLGFRWIDERSLARLGANAFLAVSAGNAERTAGIAHLRYRPRRRAAGARPDVALIGKGILFDTGGNNVKAHRGMLEMHTDMAGSAVALATILALAEQRAPLAADAWLAITENRIGPTAYRPQDVVRASNGVTIQVIHTDAEGRMVLADTLSIAGRDKPRLMIDFATLTGACVYSLTERMSGVFTNEPALVEPLLAAGRASGERVWNFPMDADFDSDLESRVADVVQCAVDGKGDHILAARFLQRFVPEHTPWAHVDLAAAQRSGGLGHIGTDITGFGVRYTLELLQRQDVLARLGERA